VDKIFFCLLAWRQRVLLLLPAWAWGVRPRHPRWRLARPRRAAPRRRTPCRRSWHQKTALEKAEGTQINGGRIGIVGTTNLLEPLAKLKIVLEPAFHQLFDWDNLRVCVIEKNCGGGGKIWYVNGELHSLFFFLLPAPSSFIFLFHYLVDVLFFEALLQKLEVLDELIVVLGVKLDLLQRYNACREQGMPCQSGGGETPTHNQPGHKTSISCT
jgi:hypothetical protein